MGSLPKQSPLWRYALTDLGGLAFAAIWGMRGLAALKWPLWLCITLIVAITLPLAWGFLSRDLRLGRPEIVVDHALAKRARRIRIIILFVAGMTLSMTHRQDLMLVVAGFVIGASYLPLGRAMKEPVHLLTGALILGITASSMQLTQPLHTIVAGLGTALAFWLGATLRLVRTLPTMVSDSARVRS